MKSEITLRVLREDKLSSIEELWAAYPRTMDKGLLVIANYTACVYLYCPSTTLVIDSRTLYPYIEIDNYTIVILSTEEVIIKKRGVSLLFSSHKALEFLWQLRDKNLYSSTIYEILKEVLPRLLQTTFIIKKVDDYLTIEYY